MIFQAGDVLQDGAHDVLQGVVEVSKCGCGYGLRWMKKLNVARTGEIFDGGKQLWDVTKLLC